MSAGRPHVSSVLSLLAAFVAASVVAGLLAAGLFVPMVGAVGAASGAAVDMFESLPDEFTTSPLSEQSVVLASDGTKIATPYDENRIIVPLAEVSPIMRTAQVAIEDHRFYDHGGADLQGIMRALISNKSAGEVTGGGSTLTQQYVKVTLQYNALRAGDKQGAAEATAKNYARKIQELKYAIALEKTQTKDQILEGYLNLVYYGDRAYGVEAAAQHYFGHSAKTLNLQESALLAGLTQNPGTTDPVKNPDRALARRNVVLDRMHELGIITDADWKTARAVPLKDMLRVTPMVSSCAASPYPYFCDYLMVWLKSDPSLNQALGNTQEQRIQAIYRGGLTIKTTFDPKTYAGAREELLKMIPVGSRANDGAYIGAATAILDVKTGGVRAIVQNTDYAVKPANDTQTQVNWAVDTKYGGSMGFQFGSTAKAFTLVALMEKGIPTTASVFAKGASPKDPAEYTNKELGGKCGLGKEPWSVRNAEPVKDGTMTLAKATAHSINTAFVGMIIDYLGGDVCPLAEIDTRMGLHQGSGEPIQATPAPLIIGANEVSPMTVASAYQTLANDGVHCAPVPVVEILKDGKPLPVPALGSQCDRRIQPEVARGVTDLMTNVFTDKAGTGRNSNLAGGRQAAGKSGTTDNNNETWFVGFTPELSTAVWVGTPNDKNNLTRLENVKVGGRYYDTMYSSVVAGPLWKQIMDRALAGVPMTRFPEPNDATVNGEKVDIPAVTRMSVNDAKALLQQAGFAPTVVYVYSGYRSGTVVGTSPRGQATRGSVVQILVSKGSPPPAPAPAPAPAPDPAAPPAPPAAPAG
ncbi:MAG TPA: transglycosylase domain-containing protein [Dermatophilaceae bacterium]|nr:transglycosylase domain-containing protein [Dermatophilaceae bacterium]